MTHSQVFSIGNNAAASIYHARITVILCSDLSYTAYRDCTLGPAAGYLIYNRLRFLYYAIYSAVSTIDYM